MLLQNFFLVAALLAAQVDTTFTVEYGSKKYEFHISDDLFRGILKATDEDH